MPDNEKEIEEGLRKELELLKSYFEDCMEVVLHRNDIKWSVIDSYLKRKPIAEPKRNDVITEEVYRKCPECGSRLPNEWLPSHCPKCRRIKQSPKLVPLNSIELSKTIRSVCTDKIEHNQVLVTGYLGDIIHEIKLKFGTPANPKFVMPSINSMEDYLDEISHNEYGDAQSVYDFSLHKDRLTIAEAILNHLHKIQEAK